MEPLARPNERKVAMAKRRCLLQTRPLLKKRPAGDTEKTVRPQARRKAQHIPRCVIWAIHPSFPSKSWSPSGCTAGPQSCRPVSRWPPSPSSTPTQTLSCVFPDGCRKHSRKHRPAAEAGAGNKSAVVKHVTLMKTLTLEYLLCYSSKVLVLSAHFSLSSLIFFFLDLLPLK